MSSLYRSILNAQGSAFASTNSFEFDGSTDFISVADNANLSFGDSVNDSPFSISLWAKLNAVASTKGIFSKFTSSSQAEYGLILTNTDQLIFRVFDISTLNRRGRITSAITSNLGDWVNIVCTYNGVGGTNADSGIKIYLNGVRIDNANSSLNTYTAMHNTNAPFNIGYQGSGYIQGNIDEVAIFNSELSASDVTTIYNGGIPNNLNDLTAPPLSWWRMGEAANYSGGAWTLTDQGSGGNDGTSTTIPAPPTQPSTDVPT